MVCGITLMNAGAYQPNAPVMMKFPLLKGYRRNMNDIRLLPIASDGFVKELKFGLVQDGDTGE